MVTEQRENTSNVLRKLSQFLCVQTLKISQRKNSKLGQVLESEGNITGQSHKLRLNPGKQNRLSIQAACAQPDTILSTIILPKLSKALLGNMASLFTWLIT